MVWLHAVTGQHSANPIPAWWSSNVSFGTHENGIDYKLQGSSLYGSLRSMRGSSSASGSFQPGLTGLTCGV